MSQAPQEGKGSETPAEVFDQLFQLAIAGPWAARLADAARIVPAQPLLLP